MIGCDIPIKILELKRQACEIIMPHENKSYLPWRNKDHV